MSDLIDRQAILKHIEKIRQSALMMDDTRRAGIIMQGMHLCEKAVRNQPSAQPEKRTEKRTETHACDLIYRSAAVDAIDKALSRTFAEPCGEMILKDVPSAQPELRWIPVTDGLPAYGEDVLISIGGYCNVGHIVSVNEEEQYNWYFSGWYHLPNDVDAWMPLPEPYREGEQDEDR